MSEMNYTQAADEARRLLRGYTAMHQLAAALDEAGSLEARISENRAIATKMAGELEDARAQLLVLRDQAGEVGAAAKLTVDEAKRAAEDILSQANFERDIIITAAKTQQEDMMAAARAMRDASDVEVIAASQRVESLKATAAELEARIADARAQVERLLQV